MPKIYARNRELGLGWDLLEGSWVVRSGVISRVTTIITRLITLPVLITTHEPPRRLRDLT